MDAVKANGIVLHVEDRGPRDAPALVFINSVGTDFRIWDAVVPQFPHHRTLRYDKRGHGLSTSEGGDSIEAHAADLAALLDARGIRRAVVVGLSIGGMIALGLTRLRPDLVGRLVLCDTAHKIGTAEAWQARIAGVEAGGVGSIAEATMERWFSADFRTRQPELVAIARNMLSRTPADGYIRACAALRDGDLTAAAEGVAVPTLCLCGTEDIATKPELVRSLAALIPGARYQDLPGAGHLPCVEAPELLAGLIRDFIGNEGAMADPLHDQGMAVRRKVLGDAHVDRAQSRTTEFDAPFQEFITRGAWGGVWTRPQLTHRERSMLTIALLAALGHHEELAMHIRATANTGATAEDIREALLHVAVYAGVPAANSAFAIAKQVFAERDGVDREETK